MSTGGIRAGEAYVEMGIKDNLNKGLNAAQRKLKAFGRSITALGVRVSALGAAMSAPLIASVKIFTSIGSQLTDMSARTGASGQALLELGYAAEQTGVGIESVEQGLRGMARFLMTAATGGGKAKAALAGVGLTLADLKGLSPEDQFIKIGDALSKVADPTQRAGLAMKLLGKSGADLLPMFAAGAKGIEAYRQHLRDLGIDVTPAAIKAADDLGDSFGDVWKQIKFAAFSIGAALAPALQDVTNWLRLAMRSTIEFLKANEVLVRIVSLVAVSLTVAGGALLAVGVGARLASMACGVLSGIVNILTGSVAGLNAALVFLYTSTAGTVIAGSLAIGGVLLWLGGAFDGLGKTAGLAISGIGDALAAGDIALAAQIMWLSLELAWKTGVHNLYEIWVGLKMGFMQVWDFLASWMIKIWNNTIGLIATGISFIASGIQSLGESVGLDLGMADLGAKERERIFNETTGKNSGVDDEVAARQDQREKAYAADLAASDHELRTLREERDAALHQAADERANLTEITKIPELNPANFDAETGMPKKVKKAHEAATQGTFSSSVAARIGGLNANPVTDRIDLTNKTLNQVVALIKQGKISPVFQ